LSVRSREALGIAGAPPFHGSDRWRAWEVMARRRRPPRVAIATFDVPCASPRIVESKSVKLWLASLNNARFEHRRCAELFRAMFRPARARRSPSCRPAGQLGAPRPSRTGRRADRRRLDGGATRRPDASLLRTHPTAWTSRW
jgi:hypothetical protein